MSVSRTIARYTVKPGMEELNAELVRAVYEQLEKHRPPGFGYATFRLEDGRTFVHVAEHAGLVESPLRSLPAFAEFLAGLDERCEWGPVVTSAELVGRFGGAHR